MNEFRQEEDSLGEMNIPIDSLYGASTQRAILNFPISGEVLDQEFINDRLKKIFKGLNFSINQVNQSYRPYDLILTLEW